MVIILQSYENGMNNIWELYGVKENPFSTSPLLVRGGTIPLESFVGREEEVKRLKKIIGSIGGSRMLIYGDVGVGKTTFVNVVRATAIKNGFFTPFKEIAIQSEWDTDQFIINTLAAIYSTINLIKEKPIKDETFQQLENLFKIGREEIAFGGNIAGIGMNYDKKTKSPSKPSTFILQQFFQILISEIYSNTNKDIIIHYNNLELMPEKKIRKTFNNLRDFFQTPKVHFIFVGNLSVYSTLQGIPRFSSILSDTPINIQTLKFEEIKKILKIRFEKLNIDRLKYSIPYNEDCLNSLFELFGGNIRNILNSLSTAVLEVSGERPIILDRYTLADTLKSVLEKRYLSKLQPRAKEVLINAVKYDEITNKQLSKNTGIARPNISLYLSHLRDAGCIYLRRKNGKDKFWTVEPKIKWMLLKEGKENQNSISLY